MQKSFRHIVKLCSNTSLIYLFVCNPNYNTMLNLQMAVYLELMVVWGREDSVQVFLWLLSNIKMSVAASYVLEKCQTDVFTSVFRDAREILKLQHDGRQSVIYAVPLYLFAISHFTIVGVAKVMEDNDRNIFSLLPELCICFALKINYEPIHTVSI